MKENLVLDNVSKALMEICTKNNFHKIEKLEIIVDNSSDLTRQELYDYLEIHNASVIGDWTEISLKREDIGGLTAIIHNLQGEQS